MFGLANRDLPTTLLPLSIPDVMLVGSEPIVQPRVQMYIAVGVTNVHFPFSHSCTGG